MSRVQQTDPAAVAIASVDTNSAGCVWGEINKGEHR